MVFRLKYIFCIVIFAFYHQVSSLPSSTYEVRNGIVEKVDKDSEKPSELSGKNYFKASQQIFNIFLGECDSSSNQDIPSDYVVVPGGGAFKFHSQEATWNDARNVCINEGGHLAVIRSAEENEYVKKYMREHQLMAAWIGVHSLFKKDEWVTVLDEPLGSLGNHAPWRAGEPNNANGNERCVEYVSPDGMDDLDCELNLRQFYCKIELENE